MIDIIQPVDDLMSKIGKLGTSDLDSVSRAKVEGLLAFQAFGLRKYQEGLAQGLQLAISVLQSIEGQDAKLACARQIEIEIQKARLPVDIIPEVIVQK